MKDNLKELEEIFLSGDIDNEDYQDNLNKIKEWGISLSQNQALKNWQDYDITKIILKQIKDSYTENALHLGTNKNLTEEQRKNLWAKQDAFQWLLNLMAQDTEKEIKMINNDIKYALSRF